MVDYPIVADDAPIEVEMETKMRMAGFGGEGTWVDQKAKMSDSSNYSTSLTNEMDKSH